MGWREVVVDNLASGCLGGITAGGWLRMLRDNRFHVSPSCWGRALSTSMLSPTNSVLRQVEQLRYAKAVSSTTVLPPVFVLGHWRSGTTHLQQLLTADQRFASPTLYQVFFPHTFLLTEALSAKAVEFVLPPIRGFDNVRQHTRMPHEDEIAICAMSGCTPYLTLTFPRRADHYDRFLTFRHAAGAERERWSADLLWFFKKLTYRSGKPLVLKSPPHTCRIALLLRLFPEARFVHIHRHPYTVFQSTIHLLSKARRQTELQQDGGYDWQARALRLYREMYDAFFEEKDLIPRGRFCEVAFDDLERDPIGQLRRVYQELSLPVFEECEPAVRRYLAEVGDYKRNRFPELSPSLRETVLDRWQPSFAEWNYQP